MHNQANVSTNIPADITKLWAEKIRRAGLAAPAIFLMELHKPLSFVIGQSILLGRPVLDFFVPDHFSHNIINLLSDRTNLECLIKELEQD